MPLDVEDLKNKALRHLKEHGLSYALGTIASEAPRDKLQEFKAQLVEEFLRMKGDRIFEWSDDDFEGVNNVLKNGEMPFEVRSKLFETLLNFYARAREQVSQVLRILTPGTHAYKITKGLLILLENFKLFTEIRKPEIITFPNIKPPDPKPPEELLKSIEEALTRSPQVLLIGPPGTGKTHLAMWAAYTLTADKGRNGRWIFVQFHRSYRYDDFIERIMIETRGQHIKLKIEPQIFVRLCRYAERNPDEKVVLVIDEINRADVASVFGELIYAIEYRGYPVKLMYSKEDLIVPENLYIIATANDIDRGTFDIGVALRRRFEVIRIDADEQALRELLRGASKDVIDIALKIFNEVNRFFERSIGKKGLGHLFFRGVTNMDSLVKAWRHRIKPLVEAYFLAPGAIGRDAQRLIREIESQIERR